MHPSLTLVRVLFVAFSVAFFAAFALSQAGDQDKLIVTAVGAGIGFLFGLTLIAFEYAFRSLNIRAINTVALGLLFGYLFGTGIILTLDTLVHYSGWPLGETLSAAIHAVIYLVACYLCVLMTAKASDDLYASIPFIKLNPSVKKSKDFILDLSALNDTRLLDLASTGILDQRLLVPRFLMTELIEQAESIDESVRTRARRALDTYKKLEGMGPLEMKTTEIDFADIKDTGAKLMRLARQLEGSILTADPTRTSHSTIDGIRVISFSSLSNAVKPLAHTGETLHIKIQRYGKEPRQGVGYLDDGTMVVVNGGAEFIGATIRAQVLSVKNTTSGRMIFCNAADGDFFDESSMAGVSQDNEISASNYFTI